MTSEVGLFLTMVVPLIAGALLLGVCALNIVRNPTLSNANVAILAVGALLSVAPSLGNFALKAPGIELSGAVKAQVGEQGAQVKRDLSEIRTRLDALAKANSAGAAPVESDSYKSNKNTTVLLFYRQPKKDLALRIENYLLSKGYSANAIYTDFSELSDAAKGSDGSISLVYAQQKQQQADEIKAELRSKFPESTRITDAVVPKLNAADIQVRLF